ncbi:putative LRR receptor-like serine/threonine-protein kinase, partial [Camellia lanceoleosa]
MYIKLDRGFVLQHDDAGWLSTRQRIATTDYESIRKFISRAWPLVLDANIIMMLQSSLMMGGRSDGFDRYRDWRLDVDNMSYEISRSIPKEVGNITSLGLLLLNGNQLTGPLPDEIGYLPNLDRIQIDQNQISGPIPKSFANLNKTKHFHMNNNSLSGQIPPELSTLPKLVHMIGKAGYGLTLPPQLSEVHDVFHIWDELYGLGEDRGWTSKPDF